MLLSHRKAEIDDFHFFERIYHDILGLEVPVEYEVAMAVSDTLYDLFEDVGAVSLGQPPSCHSFVIIA